MFESWPFTNFHDMNLDWIIKTIKNLEKTVTEWQANIKDYVLDILSDHPEWIQNWMLDDDSVSADKLADKSVTARTINNDVASLIYSQQGFLNLENLKEIKTTTHDATRYGEALAYDEIRNRYYNIYFAFGENNKTVVEILDSNFDRITEYSYNFGIPNAASLNNKKDELYIGCYTVTDNVYSYTTYIIDIDTMLYAGTLNIESPYEGYWAYDNELNQYVLIHLAGGYMNLRYYDENYNRIAVKQYQAPYYAQQDSDVKSGLIIVNTMGGIYTVDSFGIVNFAGIYSTMEYEGVTFNGANFAVVGHVSGQNTTEFFYVTNGNTRPANSEAEHQADITDYIDKDLAPLIRPGVYYVETSTVNTHQFPDNTTRGVLKVRPVMDAPDSKKATLQYFTDFDDDRVYYRTITADGGARLWTELTNYNNRVSEVTSPLASVTINGASLATLQNRQATFLVKFSATEQIPAWTAFVEGFPFRLPGSTSNVVSLRAIKANSTDEYPVNFQYINDEPVLRTGSTTIPAGEYIVTYAGGGTAI